MLRTSLNSEEIFNNHTTAVVEAGEEEAEAISFVGALRIPVSILFPYNICQ